MSFTWSEDFFLLIQSVQHSDQVVHFLPLYHFFYSLFTLDLLLLIIETTTIQQTRNILITIHTNINPPYICVSLCILQLTVKLFFFPTTIALSALKFTAFFSLSRYSKHTQHWYYTFSFVITSLSLLGTSNIAKKPLLCLIPSAHILFSTSFLHYLYGSILIYYLTIKWIQCSRITWYIRGKYPS